MDDLVTCKYEEDPIKNEGARVDTTFSLITCKYEEDPIKNKGARVVTRLYSNFSDEQGQVTLVLVSG